MSKASKPIFQIRPTAYRAWDGAKMHFVDSLCWNAGGALWYASGNRFGWAWINPDYKGWTTDNPKPSDKDICPVMQWTGLKDSKGNDIWEGDILLDDDNKHRVVQFSHGTWIVSDNEYFDNLIQRTRYAKVIGNIFENLELLKT